MIQITLHSQYLKINLMMLNVSLRALLKHWVRGVVGKPILQKASVVGVGMISKPGVAATMFQTLGEHKVNIELITTSEIKISCAIKSEQADLAVQCMMHFGLEKQMIEQLPIYLMCYLLGWVPLYSAYRWVELKIPFQLESSKTAFLGCFFIN